MKKYLLLICAMVMMVTTLTACTDNEDIIIEQKKQEIEELENEISNLESYKEDLSSNIDEIKRDNELYTYVVEFKVRQSHFSLDISEHIKDSMNELTYEIPVSKEFYDSVEIGDNIEDSFRVGSFLMKGSFGSWNISISNKYIAELQEDETTEAIENTEY